MATCLEARSFLGARLPVADLFESSKHPVCKHHDEVDTSDGNKFCSRCGKPLWRITYKPIEALRGTHLDGLGDDILVIKTGKFTRLDAEMGEDPNKVDWFATFPRCHVRTGTSDYHNKWSICKITFSQDAIHSQLKYRLEELGLWDEGTFGLYAVKDSGVWYDETK